jgi:hypothetical protein
MSIFPTPGNPNVNATASDQWLIGEPNFNYIGYSGATDNTVSYQLASGPVTASLGNPSMNTGDAAGDTYTDIQNLTGSMFGGALYGINNGQNEQLWALGGATSMFGGTGYTTFIAGDAPDNMFGQTNGGNNLADYEVATSAVTVDLANPSQNAGWAAGDDYANVHDIAGSAYDDVLTADNNPSANLLGNDGDNVLTAGTGNDTLNGGPGANVYVLGSGSDWVVFGGSAIGYGDVTMEPLSLLYNAEAGVFSEIFGFNPGSTQRIDVAPLASSLNESGQPVSSLVQIVEDTSGTFAWLQFNEPSGWVNLAQIEDIKAGQTVGVFDNTSNTQGMMLTAQATSVTNKTNTDEWILSGGKWSASVSAGSYPGPDEEIVGVGDFTGNGTDGVLWYNTNTGDLNEWQLTDGQWSASVDFGAHPGVNGMKPGPGWQVEGVGDFFGNGRSDILWFNPGDNQTDIWEVNSNGQWEASVSPGTFPGVGDKVAGIGNFFGNSTSDILWYNDQTGDTSDWEISNGQWAASEDIGAHPGSGWQIAGVGNFFGTGLDDVLWYNVGSGQTDVWEIQNGQWAGSTSLGTHPAGYEVVGIGNFAGNANGTTGVLFYNQNTGDLDEWLIANGKWAGSIDLGVHPGSYQVAGVGAFTSNNTTDVLFTQHAAT